MKILVLSFYYAPDLCPGSFRCTAFVEQLRGLVGEDCQIDVITTFPNRYASFNISAEKTEESYGLTIQRVSLPSHKSGMFDQAYAFFYFARQVLKLVKIKDYDLVFATSSRLMTAVLGAHIARKKNAKLYLDIRDIFSDSIANVLPSILAKLLSPLFFFLEKWSFKRAQHINLISSGFREYFEKHYADIPVTHFTNGVDPEFEYSKEPRTTKSKPYKVLYAGNLGEGQGLHSILPKLAKATEGLLEFKVIGDGGRRGLLAKELTDNNCKNVLLLPPISRSALIKEYEEADILFLHLNDYPAFKKVLPSKIFEYAATGKPIWAGVSGHAANFITNEIDNAVVFYPCDIEAAKNALETLNLKSINREKFIQKFKRQNIMKSMAENVLEVLG